MKALFNLKSLLLATSALLLFSFWITAKTEVSGEWPQWRGPNRDGVWRENGILEAIPASGLQIRWRAKVSAGYSGPVVAQGRVFVTDISLIRRSNVLCVWRK